MSGQSFNVVGHCVLEQTTKAVFIKISYGVKYMLKHCLEWDK